MSKVRGGSTRRWRAVRAAVLRRDGYRCRAHTEGWCAAAGLPDTHPCTHVATHAHHVHGWAATGDDPTYLVAACAPCNLAIGDPTKTRTPQGRVTVKQVTQW